MLSPVQIILFTLIAAINPVERMTVHLFTHNVITMGLICGLIVGNPMLGLLVGATLQAYSLGMGSFGGSSIPQYEVACLIVVALAGSSGNVETTIALVGIPVAALTVQLDILARFLNSFWNSKLTKEVEGNCDPKVIYRWNLMGAFVFSATRWLPVLICLLVGPNLVTILGNVIPETVNIGLRCASRMMPAVGFAILLRYLPTKDNVQYLIIGFVLSAWLGMSTIGVTAIGVALALMAYKAYRNKEAVQEIRTALEDEGGNYDE